MLIAGGSGHLRGVADVVGALATGQRGQGWLAFVLTLVLVLLLAVSGAWAGGAVRRLLVDAPAPTGATEAVARSGRPGLPGARVGGHRRGRTDAVGHPTKRGLPGTPGPA